nr:MAG TPA: hypothetical protein [Caudoviricetes sp.]
MARRLELMEITCTGRLLLWWFLVDCPAAVPMHCNHMI